MGHSASVPASASITRVSPADIPLASDVLTQAFMDDPVMLWLFPDGARRRRFLDRFHRIALSKFHVPHDEVYRYEDAAVAVWDPPGKWRIGFWQMIRDGAPLVGAMGSRVFTGMRALGYVESKHPKDLHYYLAILGTIPARQGQGLGSRLLQCVLDRCDSEGMPAYLEASTEDSKRLYERHGFELVEKVFLPPDGPPVWRMWRTPSSR